MRYDQRPAALGFAVLTIVLAGCAAQPHVLDARQGTDADLAPSADPEVLVGLAVSGGGSRAATFTASVLEELTKIKIAEGGRQRSFVEYVDTISSVSGGSLATAYYGINKPERGVPALQGDGLSKDYIEFFRKFQANMTKNYEESLWRSWYTDATRRAENLADTWNEDLFRKATFHDLSVREQKGDSPKIVLNGTSWDDGRRFVMTNVPMSEFSFEFTNEVIKDLANRPAAADDLRELKKHAEDDFYRFRPITFEEMNADPRKLPVSVAVAASSSVPLIIGPVMFQTQGSDRKHHIGDGGLFDNQGIESVAQIFFKKLGEPARGGVPRKGLIVVIDASYPFKVDDEDLRKAKSALELLKMDPSRVSDIMEQRARAYQLLLWAHLRGTRAVVPNRETLRIVYLRHTDVNEKILDYFPEKCGKLVDNAPTLEKIKTLLNRIPTRFEIKECHALLLGAAARNLVETNRAAIGGFLGK